VRVSRVILTAVGYLLLFLSGVAVCLFCWLSYCSLTGAARRRKQAAKDSFLDDAAHDITPPISAGSR